MFEKLPSTFVQGIVDPPAIRAITNEAGLFQYFEMEAEPRLGRLQGIRELTDTLLAVSQSIEDLQARLI